MHQTKMHHSLMPLIHSAGFVVIAMVFSLRKLKMAAIFLYAAGIASHSFENDDLVLLRKPRRRHNTRVRAWMRRRQDGQQNTVFKLQNELEAGSTRQKIHPHSLLRQLRRQPHWENLKICQTKIAQSEHNVSPFATVEGLAN